MTKIGALEAGGTKMVLAVYDGDGQELERLTIPTEAPEITMPRMTGFFRDHAIDALGVGSFGPLDLNPCLAHVPGTSPPPPNSSGVIIRC